MNGEIDFQRGDVFASEPPSLAEGRNSRLRFRVISLCSTQTGRRDRFLMIPPVPDADSDMV